MSNHMLHIMGASRWDDIGAIIGDRLALQGLRDALDEALATGSGGTFVFHSDGEPYSLVVAMEPDMQQLQTAYAAEKAPQRSARETTPMRAAHFFQDGYRKAIDCRNHLRQK